VNGEEVRGTSFRRRSAGGYSAIEVDDLLRRVAAELDAGQPAGPLIANATFQSGGKRSYDIDAVDWFLGQLTSQPNSSDLAGLGSREGNISRRLGHGGTGQCRHASSAQGRRCRLRLGYDGEGRLPPPEPAASPACS